MAWDHLGRQRARPGSGHPRATRQVPRRKGPRPSRPASSCKLVVGYHVSCSTTSSWASLPGRVLADADSRRDTRRSTDDLAELLIEAGHARPYDGGARAGWCESNSALLDEKTVAYSELTSARLRLLADGKQNEAEEIQTQRETLRAEIDEALYGGK